VGLLLDTHIFYWAMLGSVRLSERHRTLCEDRTRPIYVSAVTGWEIAIKVKLGKWPEAIPLLPNLSKLALYAGFQPLDITLAQAERAGSLELVHRDPFDRLLAAQALELGIPIATVDPAMTLLGCQVV
jgi:PIN domain nuclease of toxin-antitoxin system